MSPNSRAYALQGSFGQDEITVGVMDGHVVQRRPDGQREVARQRPRRRRPREEFQWSWVLGSGGQRERHGDGRILPGSGGIVEADLEIAQRCLCAPRVRHHPVGLIQQALVPQLLERPHHRLHVVEIHGFVVVFEIHPSGLAGDVVLPLVRVAQYRRSARLVEVVDAEVENRLSSRYSELLFGLHLGRKAVAVPTESSFDARSPSWCGSGE